MNDGNSGEFWHAYVAYHKSGLLPSFFSVLPHREKAMLIAFHEIEAEEKNKADRQNHARARNNRRKR